MWSTAGAFEGLHHQMPPYASAGNSLAFFRYGHQISLLPTPAALCEVGRGRADPLTRFEEFSAADFAPPIGQAGVAP
jgi:hypothetical protein